MEVRAKDRKGEFGIFSLKSFEAGTRYELREETSQESAGSENDLFRVFFFAVRLKMQDLFQTGEIGSLQSQRNGVGLSETPANESLTAGGFGQDWRRMSLSVFS